MADVEINNFAEKLNQRINDACILLLKLDDVSIDGVSKLRNKIKQEIAFLTKTKELGSVKKEHLECSNLKHLEAVVHHLLHFKSISVAVMSNKVLTTENSSKKLCVDLILHGGSVWVKVIARNAKALTQLWLGDGTFGQKNIVEQSLEFVDCSRQHLHYYKPPKIVFSFAYGVEKRLAVALKRLGVVVISKKEDLSSLDDYSPTSETPVIDPMIRCPISELDVSKNFKVIENMGPGVKLNLGVTTMIAYVSALTNGGTNYRFDSEVLTKHAKWERLRPVKPILDRLFKDRELYCCQTALENFTNILNTLGGPSEKERGAELLKRMSVVEDHSEMIDAKIRPGNRVKLRSLAIFGTGEFLKAVTVTANHAFVRSCLNQGVTFPVFLHESRALTEGKQLDL